MSSLDFCLSERGAVATWSQLGSVNRNPAQMLARKNADVYSNSKVTVGGLELGYTGSNVTGV